MSEADNGSEASSDSSTPPPWRAQGSGPPPEVVDSVASNSEGTTTDSDEPVPEWKKKFKAMKEREHPIEPTKPKAEQKEEDIPEWKKKFQTMRAKNPGLDDSMSDVSVSSEQQRQISRPPRQEESSLDDAKLPEWKKKLMAMQEKHKDHPIEPTKPKTEPKEEDIPEWKKKFNQMHHIDESGKKTPVTANKSLHPDAQATKPKSPREDEEEMPEWKRKLQEMETRKSGRDISAEQQASPIEETPISRDKVYVEGPQQPEVEMEQYVERELPVMEGEDTLGEPPFVTQPESEASEIPSYQPAMREENFPREDVTTDDIYGALAGEGAGGTEEEYITEEYYEGDRGEPYNTDEVIEEVFDDEYEEEIIEEVVEDQGDTDVGQMPAQQTQRAPQDFATQAPAPHLLRPIPQMLQPTGNQFQPSPSGTFQVYRPPPPPPPGAPPLRQFPAPPDPPLHGILKKDSFLGSSVGTTSVTDEEARLLEEMWQNELRKDDGVDGMTDEEANLLDEIWENELKKDSEVQNQQRKALLSGDDPLRKDRSDHDTEIEEGFDDEYIYQEDFKRRNFWERPIVMGCVCLVFVLLLALAIMLLLWLLVDNVVLWGKPNSSGPTPAPTHPFSGALATTSMDPYVAGRCDTTGQVQPNILTQCSCDGRVASLQSNVRAKYEALKNTFIVRIYPSWPYYIESCNPANQALLWLSTTIAKDDTDLLQRYALASLYYQTNGQQWRRQDNWLSDTDVCTWYGIACSNNALVGMIGLERNSIAGSIPLEIGLLSAIQSIFLEENAITGTIPGELFSPPLLRKVSLFSNQLNGSIPREVGSAVNLDTLRLDRNQLAGSIPPEVGRATSLKELDLSFNDFSNEIPGDMYYLTKLTSLNLEDNSRLSGRLPTEFGRFTDLEFFSISNTTIRARIPREYEALTKLTDLRMANTLVGGNIPDEISVLSDLFNADLANSQFRQTIPTIVGNFRKMTVLLLDNNGLTGEIPSQIGLMTNLTILRLDGNDFQGTIPSAIGELTFLETLNIAVNPQLTGRIPSEICELRSLNLKELIIDCPTRDQAPVCPIPSCCTSCVELPSSGYS